MKRFLFILLGIPVFTGCNDTPDTENQTYDPEINFDVSMRTAAGMDISCLYARDETNYFYAVGNQIFIVENSQVKVVEAASAIFSLAWNSTLQSLWFGTKSSGLGQLKDGQITYYDQKKDRLPRDLVSKLVCDNDGTVWFSSSAFQLGGLGKFRDGKFTFFTPDNSDLPDNLIKSIACLGNKIYVATGGTVTLQKVMIIDHGKWKSLPIEGYYLMDMDVDQNGNVYVIDNTGLSSSMMPNKIYRYADDKCMNILPQESGFSYPPLSLKTDLRNYLWCAKAGTAGKKNLSVYDGNAWHDAPSGFPEVYIRCISVDTKNNIWLGTSDGIYVLNQ